VLSWAVGFFIIAVVAALFGFGAIASTFAGIAQLLFWLFLALFVLSIVFSLFSSSRGHVHSPAVTSGGRSVMFVALVAGLAVLAYAWVDNDWTAQEVGRNIDNAASEITADAGQAVETASDRAENLIDNTGQEMRSDASEALDNASDDVAPKDERANNN
jgi:uncharacterized membrane protein YtjA (UPF0391 family)